MDFQKKIVLYLAFIALLGTITNFVYLSPLLTLLVPLCIYMLTKEKLQKPIVWLYAYLLLFLISTALYDVNSLVNFGFYRRDGNFIISYAPLFVLPLFSFQFNLKKYLRYFYLFALSIYFPLFMYYLFNVNFSAGIHEVLFGGLFYAQNAVGGFLSILGSLGFAYYYNRRNRKEFLFFFLIFLMLALTYSRGSILGLLLGIAAWYLAIKGRFKTLIALLVVPILLTAGSLMIGYPYYKNNIAAGNVFKEEVLFEQDNTTKNTNILLRIFYTFPRAYYLFVHSPVWGTGVGSLDDRPYEVEQTMIPYLMYNAQPQKVHTDSHAHHSYLHILAEQGIVGLVVFLTFWIVLFWYLMNLKHKPVIRDYLLIAFFTITFASFTEHRITTPSMMLPFTLSLGLLLVHKDEIKKCKILRR